MKTRFAVALLLLWGCGEAASGGRDGGDAARGGDSGRAGAPSPRDAGRDGGDGGADAGAWQPPEVRFPELDSTEPFHLSQTGLYADIAEKRLAPDLIAFEPTYKLWSDGADKHRWLRLPEGTRIDSSDPDHFIFPIGAVAFKEFVRDGKRVETRVIARLGEADDDFFMGAFLWDDDEADARFVPDGQPDARGTDHDVPKVKFCFTCHNGDRGRILGYSAVQQPDAPQELLTDPVSGYYAPGDAVTAAALGYLHANCGHCHNPDGTARPDTDMDLRLRVSDLVPEETAAYASTLGVELQYFEDEPVTFRVVPGDPDDSGIVFRMSMRGPKTQMPPLATELVDDEGVAAVRAWIESLK